MQNEITEARDKLTEAHSILLGNHPRSEVALLLLDAAIILDALATAEAQPVAGECEPWWISELRKHWGEGETTHDTRRAALVAVNQFARPPSVDTEARRMALEEALQDQRKRLVSMHTFASDWIGAEKDIDLLCITSTCKRGIAEIDRALIPQEGKADASINGNIAAFNAHQEAAGSGIMASRTTLPPAVTESELVERALAAVKAWDELPGDRLYSPKVVESWMIHHMATAIYALRAALANIGKD